MSEEKHINLFPNPYNKLSFMPVFLHVTQEDWYGTESNIFLLGKGSYYIERVNSNDISLYDTIKITKVSSDE